MKIFAFILMTIACQAQYRYVKSDDGRLREEMYEKGWLSCMYCDKYLGKQAESHELIVAKRVGDMIVCTETIHNEVVWMGRETPMPGMLAGGQVETREWREEDIGDDGIEGVYVGDERIGVKKEGSTWVGVVLETGEVKFILERTYAGSLYAAKMWNKSGYPSMCMAEYDGVLLSVGRSGWVKIKRL